MTKQWKKKWLFSVTADLSLEYAFFFIACRLKRFIGTIMIFKEYWVIDFYAEGENVNHVVEFS